jgi:ubiquinone/menaquinone biosynthesis C-methylase UbiE
MDACYAAQRIAFGPVVFQACRVLRDLGVLHELHRHSAGVTLTALQSGTDLSRYALKLLLESGMSADVVRLEDERWHLTRTGWFLLEDELTRINMDFVHHVNYQALFHLDRSIHEERPVGLAAFGDWPVIYPGLSSLPAPVRDSWFRFDHYYSDAAIDQECATVLAEHPRKVLEIGGNTGSFSMALAAASDDAAITLLDLPEQIALAKQRFAAHALDGRIGTVAADMLDGKPLDGEYDLIWMSQFLDCFGQADIVRVLRKARGALARNGSILIMEPLWDRQRFEVSAYCIINTSPYFTVMANGCSKMSSFTDLQRCIADAGLEVGGTRDGLGICQTILRCRQPA